MEHDLALCVHSYYVGEHAAGRRACERLLARPDLTDELEHMVRTNRTWYTPALDELATVRHQRIDVEPAHEGWSLFNPTIASHRDDLVCLVRSSNYKIVDGRYEMPAADGSCIRTENVLVVVHPDLTVASARVISGPGYPHTGFPVTGLEDCRLRYTQTGLGVSATVRDVGPFDGRCRIATADLDVQAATFSGLRVLDGINVQEHEKNWMPFVGREGWLYASNHNGHVVTVDPDGSIPGAWQVSQRRPSPAIAKRFRGGSQLLAFHDGWLGLVHEVAALNGRRVYEHRFVWLDADLELRRVSPAFAFREKQTIEFAAGLAWNGLRLVASYGVRDAEAWLVEIDPEDAWRLLSPAMSA